MHITHLFCASVLLGAASAVSAEDAAPTVATSVVAAEREAWLADYAGLKASVQQGYANLDWIVAHRGLDLADLDRRTIERLAAAQSRADAVSAIDDFFTAFRDPHFRPSRGAAPAASLRNAAGVVAPEWDDAPPSAEDEQRSQGCVELGYKARARSGAFEPVDLENWTPLESPFFVAGTTGRAAVLRIPSFSETDYLAACEAAWQPGRTARETQLATRAVLQAELVRLVRSLHDGGAEVLVIDITGNGGGSEWSEEAATLFAAQELQRPSPRLVDSRCDRSAVWRNETVCSNLTPPGEIDRMSGQGAWQGPVAILVDKRSASAAEDFAYWLAGGGVAQLVGERTFGAGCGYIDGGWAYQFTAFDAHAMMPNCSRYTAEGVNQIEGLAPDISIDWAQGVASLPAALDRIAG
jgi:hypothetical protein